MLSFISILFIFPTGSVLTWLTLNIWCIWYFLLPSSSTLVTHVTSTGFSQFWTNTNSIISLHDDIWNIFGQSCGISIAKMHSLPPSAHTVALVLLTQLDSESRRKTIMQIHLRLLIVWIMYETQIMMAHSTHQRQLKPKCHVNAYVLVRLGQCIENPLQYSSVFHCTEVYRD